MNIVKKYNGLNGSEMTRAEIAAMLKAAEQEEQPLIAEKLRSVLNENEDETFEITVENPQMEALPASFLAGIDFMAMPEDENLGLGKAVSPDDIYQYITDLMVNTIKEVGHLPWQREWKKTSLFNGYQALNFDSKKGYRGVNYFLLNFEIKIIDGEEILAPSQKVAENPYFLTFNQIEKHKGKLKKGSTGKKVIYFTKMYFHSETLDNGETLEFGTYNKKKFIAWIKKHQNQLKILKRKGWTIERLANKYIPILKYYNVFHAGDVTGIDWGLIPKNENVDKPVKERIEIAEKIIELFPNKPKIIFKGDQPLYNPRTDSILMTPIEAFKKEQNFYTTLFHECVHSTGHRSRLSRPEITLGKLATKRDYAFEELVAEMGAVFLSAESGILFSTKDNSAKYLRGWNSKLVDQMKEDNRFFFRASSRSQAAADYILDRDKDGVPAYRKELGKKLAEKPKKEAKKVAEKPTKFILNDLPKKYEKRIYESSIAELKGATQVEDEILRTAAQNMIDLLDQKLFVLLNFKNGYGRNADRAEYRNVPTVYRKLLKKDLSKIGSVEVLKFLLEKLKEYKHDTAWESYGFEGKNAHEINKIVNFNIRSIEKFLGDGEPPKKTKKEEKKTVKNTDVSFENKYGVTPQKAVELLNINRVVLGALEGKNFVDFPRDILLLNQKEKLGLKPKKVYDLEYAEFSINELKPTKPSIPRKTAPESLKRIVSKDALRESLTGVLVEPNAYVATDAHVLAVIQANPPKTDVGKILNLSPKKTGHDKKYVDAKYPNYKAVIPDYNHFSNFFDIDTVLSKVKATVDFFKPAQTKKNALVIRKDGLAVDPAHLLNVLIVLKQSGAKKVKLAASELQRSIVIETDNDSLGLVMPIRLDEETNTVEYILLDDSGMNGPKPGKKGKIKERDLFSGLAGAKTDFNKQILQSAKKGYSADEIFILGYPQGELKKHLPNYQITLSGKVIEKATAQTKDHNLNWGNIVDLPKSINNPQAIFKSKTKGFVVLTYMKDVNDKPVMVAVHMESKKESIFIASIYARSNFDSYIGWIKEGLLLFVDKKSKLFPYAPATIAIGRNNLHSHKDNKKTTKPKKSTKKSDKKGLAAPEPKPETLHKVAQPYTKPEKNKKIRSIGAQSESKSDFFNVPGEVGKFLQAVERKPVHSVVITLDGHQGSGKTTFLYQIMNAFAAGGNKGIFLSLEEHPESHLAKEKAEKYITPQNRAYLDTIGDLDNTAELYDLIADYDIIYIDSWQKLQRIVGRIRLDEDLRKKFDGKVFVIIFQQTTTGRTKGGSEVVYDGDIITKLVKEPKFEDNYAYFDKNRYTRIPLETIRYNIAQAKTYNPEGGEIEPETVPSQIGNFGSLNVTALD